MFVVQLNSLKSCETSAFEMLYVFVLLGILVATASSQSSSCLTPNGESAQCIDIHQCDVLRRVVGTQNSEIIRFLRESQCGYETTVGPLVCCGSVAYFQNNLAEVNIPTSAVSEASRDDLLPDRNTCGQDIADRILGGKNTELTEYPWLALLLYSKSDGSFTFSCGGSLISKRYVLTAAHCTKGAIIQQVGNLSHVRLGEYDIRQDIDCTPPGSRDCNYKPVDVIVENAIVHPNYQDSSRNRYHDIALVRLNEEVVFTTFIKPICLPQASERTPIGSNVTVSGWGRTENSSFSDVKLKVKVPIVSDSRCRQLFRSSGVIIRDNQICAGGIRNEDSCNGDSGGPLMQYIPNVRPARIYVEGVVSFGVTCGTEGFPAIYTRVSDYLSWIYENIES